MEYLYHRVPKNMKGSVLYPLNVLKDIDPDIYTEHVKKYEGREQLLTTEIPPLHCLWNDVLHFTAVAPHELKENLAKAGIEYTFTTHWYKVPVSIIKGENSIAFTYRRDLSIVPDFRNYEPFDVSRMNVYRSVPSETIEYYKEMKAQDKLPLQFHMVPHILYKGSIETKDLEIVSV